jgi:hypothetical protein
MAKAKKPTPTAAALTVRERVLFRVASGTDWQHASMTGEAVATMIVKWSAALSGSLTTPRYCHAHR